MRFRQAIVFVAAVLFSAAAASDEPIVSLAIEPEPEASAAPTLESAARANDFPTFDALYRAEPDAAFRTLHELWTYSMTERAGAFYGPDVHQRLSREYPAYAGFIESYRIVDANGNAFYPVSETRAFLLDHRAPAAPRVVAKVAKVETAPEKTVAAAAPAPVRRKTVTPEPAPAPQPQRQPASPHSTPEITDRQLLAVAGEPAPSPAPAPAQPVVREPAPAPSTPVAPAPSPSTNRGLLLVIIGLVGVGLLALIVRAPREVIP